MKHGNRFLTKGAEKLAKETKIKANLDCTIQIVILPSTTAKPLALTINVNSPYRRIHVFIIVCHRRI